MKTYGENTFDKIIIEKILISSSHKYDTIVTILEQTKDSSTLYVTKLVESLKGYEQRLSRYDKDTIKNVFQSKLKFRSQNKGYERNEIDREKCINKENS